jgi:hypothetical protein
MNSGKRDDVANNVVQLPEFIAAGFVGEEVESLSF